MGKISKEDKILVENLRIEKRWVQGNWLQSFRANNGLEVDSRVWSGKSMPLAAVNEKPAAGIQSLRERQQTSQKSRNWSAARMINPVLIKAHGKSRELPPY